MKLQGMGDGKGGVKTGGHFFNESITVAMSKTKSDLVTFQIQRVLELSHHAVTKQMRTFVPNLPLLFPWESTTL